MNSDSPQNIPREGSPERVAAEMNESRPSYTDSRTSQTDDPPNSRLFIVGNKRLNESDFREAFSEFGEIEDIWVVRDRRNGENKGVTYIKYSKTSEAANALEAMNGKILPGTDRHIKVMIASSRDKGSQREENEDEKIHRLFVLIQKTVTETDLHTYFRQFGDIDYVNIVRDKDTRESKGFAYIKYYKFSHAAKAFEECDRKYKAVFSEPRKPNMGRHNNDYSMDRISGNNMSNMPSNVPNPLYNDSQFNNNDNKFFKLMVIGSPFLSRDQLWKLFNIVPGLEYCQLRLETAKKRTTGSVIYNSYHWASHAIDRLHGFEYPSGSRLIVKPDGTVPRQENNNSRPTSHLSCDTPNLRQLAETIAQATTIIQNAGLGSALGNFGNPSPRSGTGTESDVGDVCNIKLPDPQPLASIDSETEARCFIVCTPPPPPPPVLRDIFSRFGNLIDVYMLANRNCGYAKYASKQSAQEAIKVLHGAEVCGGRMKVLEAEERSDQTRKRLRLDDH